MAADRDVQDDFQAHSQDYSFFTQLMKWGTILSIIVAAFVVLMIAS
jgi:hypothetical protein